MIRETRTEKVRQGETEGGMVRRALTIGMIAAAIGLIGVVFYMAY
jgi:hypothetical protein